MGRYSKYVSTTRARAVLEHLCEKLHGVWQVLDLVHSTQRIHDAEVNERIDCVCRVYAVRRERSRAFMRK